MYIHTHDFPRITKSKSTIPKSVGPNFEGWQAAQGWQAWPHSNDFPEFSLPERRHPNHFIGQVSFTTCNLCLWGHSASFFFPSFNQCLPSPFGTWVHHRHCVGEARCRLAFHWEIDDWKFGSVLPPYSSDVHARIQARCWIFPTSPACSENGSDPCGPRKQGSSFRH